MVTALLRCIGDFDFSTCNVSKSYGVEKSTVQLILANSSRDSTNYDNGNSITRGSVN